MESILNKAKRQAYRMLRLGKSIWESGHKPGQPPQTIPVSNPYRAEAAKSPQPSSGTKAIDQSLSDRETPKTGSTAVSEGDREKFDPQHSVTPPPSSRRNDTVGKTTQKRYSALYPKFKGMNDAFAFFYFDPARGETWETPIARVAIDGISMPESWEYTCAPSPNTRVEHFPILTNYLNYTFLRLQDQGYIEYSDNSQIAVCNTGLLTEFYEDIYALFEANSKPESGRLDWVFKFYTAKTDIIMSYLRSGTLPRRATYHTDLHQLVYDPSWKLKLRDDISHLFMGENEERLPKHLQGPDNRRRAGMIIKGAIEEAKKRALVKWNLAVPQWFNGRPQLLLPLCLGEDASIPDAALTLEEIPEERMYDARTMLTMNMAYSNARLICKPEGWLHP